MGKAEWALGAMLLSAITAALVASHTEGEPDNWLFHYQTLFTGLLALVAAVAAAMLLHRQIKQESELARETTAGRRQAARSWLSLHLSSIIGYAEDTGKGVWKLIRACDENGQLPDQAPIPKFPELPMDAAVAVKEFTDFATREEAKFIAVMLSTMQVLHSRVGDLRTTRRMGRHVLNLEAYLKDSAELYARSEALLGYARHKTEAFPKGVTWGRYEAAFFNIARTHEPSERIARHIREGSGGDPEAFLPNRFERDPD